MNGRVIGFHQLVQKLGHSKEQVHLHVTPNALCLESHGFVV